MAVKKEDAEALANECAQLTTGLPMGEPLLRKADRYPSFGLLDTDGSGLVRAAP